jgi:protein SCO1/2
MLKLQHSFKRYNISIRLLSITVDPDRDTPQHLRAYTDELKADLGTWSFVTGDLEQIQRLAGVLLPVAAKDKAERSHPVWKIAVTDKLWLIDQQGRIRGRPQQTGPPIPYYLTTAEGFDEIFHRAQHTLWQKYNTPKTRD